MRDLPPPPPHEENRGDEDRPDERRGPPGEDIVLAGVTCLSQQAFDYGIPWLPREAGSGWMVVKKNSDLFCAGSPRLVGGIRFELRAYFLLFHTRGVIVLGRT